MSGSGFPIFCPLPTGTASTPPRTEIGGASACSGESNARHSDDRVSYERTRRTDRTGPTGTERRPEGAGGTLQAGGPPPQACSPTGLLRQPRAGRPDRPLGLGSVGVYVVLRVPERTP